LPSFLAQEMTLAPGIKLGPYEILSAIGSGGMGEVWKARDTRLGRIVAIKKVKEQHSERFKQEARSIAALNHSNICQIFDIGDDYLVLEYVEGKPLSNPLPEQETVRLAIQSATALETAHKKGIIHRDFKLSNIMVSGEGTVKLLDFGLGETDKGLDWLDKAVEEHENIVLTHIISPFLDPFRSHPRYKALLQKMNLEFS
jgi:serine/threonine protein kinase